MTHGTPDLRPEAYFDLSDFTHRALFDGRTYVWEALEAIPGYVDAFCAGLDFNAGVVGDVEPGALILGERIVVARGAVIEAGAQIRGRDIYIAEGATLEAGAYIKGEGIYIGPGALIERAWLKGRRILVDRGAKVLVNSRLRDNVILSEGVEAGFAADIKNAVFLPHAAAAHFVYAGDSLVGRRVNLADKTTLSNLRHDSRAPRLRVGETALDSGLRKFGAILGDKAEVGCNAVLNPGTVMGPRALVTPTVVVTGYIPPATIAHVRTSVHFIPRRD